MRTALAATLLLAACAHQAPRPLPGETVTLKVAYVVNPALPRMKEEQLQAVLAAARQGAKENFGVEVEFTEPEELALKLVLGLVKLMYRSAGSPRLVIVPPVWLKLPLI